MENEITYLDRITQLLESTGLQVAAATNMEDALAQAERFAPDVLCQELDIPVNRGEWDREPSGGNESAGLRVLESVRTLLPEAKVVIPTTLYDRDDLRAWATLIRCASFEFCPKGEFDRRGFVGSTIIAFDHTSMPRA